MNSRGCCDPYLRKNSFAKPLSTFICLPERWFFVELSAVPQNFLWLASKETEDWLRSRGAGKGDLKGVTLTARRLVFDLVVRAMAYEYLRGKLGLPSFKKLEPRDHLKALHAAADKTGLRFLAPTDDLTAELMRSPIARIAAKASALIQSTSKDSSDLIGDLYLQTFPPAIRKRRGEFYTPSQVSSLMAHWALRSADDVVLDPAVGSGTFLLQSAALLKSLGATSAQCAAQLIGIDISPTSCLMTLANLIPFTAGSPLRLIEGDFFSIRRHGISLSPMTLGKVDAVICNPPYSRHHELTSKRKEELARLMEVESGLRLSRLASLYVHFMIHAATFLKEGGRLAFLTPAEFMDVNYGQIIRTYLLTNFRIDAFVLFRRESTLFGDALTTSCVTLATKGTPPRNHLVRFARVLGSRGANGLHEALEAEKPFETGDISVRQFPQHGLALVEKWSPLFFVAENLPSSGGHRLKEVASVRRGIATGANEFFTVSDRTIAEWGLEPEFLTPIIPHARSVLYYNFTREDWNRLRVAGDRVWMVSSRMPLNELKGTNLRRYLEWGESNGVSRRYIPSHREPWYSSESMRPQSILFTYMGRRRPRFVLNESTALNLNNLHGVTPSREFLEDPIKLKALLASANGQMTLEDPAIHGRTYGGGLTKFEPREVENLPLREIGRRSSDELKRLAGGFDELCSVARSGPQSAIVDALRKLWA
jgi:tRNA1(Val) A37 N6-methylase TrmN6